MLTNLVKRAVCLAFIALAGIHAGQAQTWVASTGTTTPSDFGKISISNGTVYLKSGVGQATLRYNLLPVPNYLPLQDFPSSSTHACRILGVRYQAPDHSVRVQLRLKEVNLVSGAVTTKMVFDSFGAFQTPGFHTEFSDENSATCPRFNYSFGDSLYYVEATLTRTTGSAQVGLSGLLVNVSDDTPPTGH